MFLEYCAQQYWGLPTKDGESFSASGFKATVTSEACCVAMCADTNLLATGHQHGIRLWGLPGVKKMGLLQTRGAAVSLDIGQRGELLAAVLLSGDSFCVCAWDLTSLCPRAAALWQLPVPSTPLHFLAEGLMVSSPQGLQLLESQLHSGASFLFKSASLWQSAVDVSLFFRQNTGLPLA